MNTSELYPDESIILTYRQTEMVLIKPLLLISLGLYIPWYLGIKFNVIAQYRVLFSLLTLAIALYGVRAYILWQRHQYVITTKRLIRLTHDGIFKKVVIETPLERILNVSYKTTGFWSSIMRYGDVEVQVVGLVEPLILSKVKEPSAVKDYLWRLHEEKSKPMTNDDLVHMQEKVGYTKSGQKVL